MQIIWKSSKSSNHMKSPENLQEIITIIKQSLETHMDIVKIIKTHKKISEKASKSKNLIQKSFGNHRNHQSIWNNQNLQEKIIIIMKMENHMEINNIIKPHENIGENINIIRTSYEKSFGNHQNHHI